ncbi:MAG: hypothetical protein NVS4B1_26340 [Ktedonobacteraceae bacterium]
MESPELSSPTRDIKEQQVWIEGLAHRVGSLHAYLAQRTYVGMSLSTSGGNHSFGMTIVTSFIHTALRSSAGNIVKACHAQVEYK